ncbi:hypothetical protein [Rasiella sp. SM2506]|uniref:hypothetical protein n=1 Tax=Rasiella sp. SM2506 TaxID=3423914 RepID=UPI003D7A5EF1
MKVKQSYWMRYPYGGGYRYETVVADTLEEAFDKISQFYNVDPTEAEYMNRIINVLE